MVIDISDVAQEKVIRFLDAHDNCLLFQSYRYYQFLLNYLDCRDFSFVSVDQDGDVNGCLFLLGKEGKYGLVLNSLPFYGSNGGIIASDLEVKVALADYYNHLIQREEVVSATIINSPLMDDAPFYRENIDFNFEDYRIGQLTPLNFSRDDEILASFHSKTRNMVRKAEKLGVQVTIDNDAMDFIVDVHTQNMLDISGKAKTPSFFESVIKHYIKGVDYQIYTASIGGERIAGLLLLNYKDIVEYFTPVVKSSHRETQALSLIIYQVMKDKFHESRYLNWGGTWPTQEGVHRFKKRWGSVDKNYYYFTSLKDTSLLREDLDSLCDLYQGFYLFPFKAAEGKQ